MIASPQNTPDSACCLGCGYLLRGLEQPVCPECGLKFDPADPTSFAATAKVRLWRRWRWRLIGMFALAALLFVIAPRGSQTGSLTFTCANCTKTVTVKRWQLLPPKWMPRYPGYTWCEKVNAAPNSESTCTHNYSVSFKFSGGYVATSGSITLSLPSTGMLMANAITINRSTGQSMTMGGPVFLNSAGTMNAKRITINGQPVTPETAESDLKKILHPTINGVGP